MKPEEIAEMLAGSIGWMTGKAHFPAIIGIVQKGSTLEFIAIPGKRMRARIIVEEIA